MKMHRRLSSRVLVVLGLTLSMTTAGCLDAKLKKKPRDGGEASQSTPASTDQAALSPQAGDDEEVLGLLSDAYLSEEQDLSQQGRHDDLNQGVVYLAADERDEARQQILEWDDLEGDEAAFALGARKDKMEARRAQLAAQAAARKEKVAARASAQAAKRSERDAKRAAAEKARSDALAAKAAAFEKVKQEKLALAAAKRQERVNAIAAARQEQAKKRQERLAKVAALKAQVEEARKARLAKKEARVTAQQQKLAARKAALKAKVEARRKAFRERIAARKDALAKKETELLATKLNPHYRKYMGRDVSPDELAYWHRKVRLGHMKVPDIKRVVRLWHDSGAAGADDMVEPNSYLPGEEAIDESDCGVDEELDMAALEKESMDDDSAAPEEKPADAPDVEVNVPGPGYPDDAEDDMIDDDIFIGMGFGPKNRPYGGPKAKTYPTPPSSATSKD